MELNTRPEAVVWEGVVFDVTRGRSSETSGLTTAAVRCFRWEVTPRGVLSRRWPMRWHQCGVSERNLLVPGWLRPVWGRVP